MNCRHTLFLLLSLISGKDVNVVNASKLLRSGNNILDENTTGSTTTMKSTFTTIASASQSRKLNSPSIGTFRPLILLVRFTDHGDRELPPRDHFLSLCTDQIKPYFAEQSYGQYNIECDVVDWMNTDNTEAFYANGNSNFQGSDLSAGFFIPVLNQLDASGTDWSLYDADQDGNLDAVLVIHSGYAAEQGDGASCGAADRLNRIYSQGHSNSAAWNNADYTRYLNGYAIAPAFDRLCPGQPASMGVMTHEWIHTFEAPDLYNTGESGGTLGGIGLYDIMSNAWGPAGNGDPASLSVFTKYNVGWITPKEITTDGVYTITSIQTNADAYIIRMGFASDEYLLLENRGNFSRDDELPGSGILIYHVDNTLPEQNRVGFPGQDGWPSNGNHFKVAILQADGKYDLEQSVNNGDAGDYWSNGMILGPGNGQTYPNTDSYQGGFINPTGITISEFSAPGDSMTFRVSGLGGEGGSVPTVPTPASSPAPIEVTVIGTNPPSSSGGAVIISDTSTPTTLPPSTPPPAGTLPPSMSMVETSAPFTPQPSTPPPATAPPGTSPPGTSPPGTSAPVAANVPETGSPETGPPSTPAPTPSFEVSLSDIPSLVPSITPSSFNNGFAPRTSQPINTRSAGSDAHICFSVSGAWVITLISTISMATILSIFA